jgi:hypothetical protein
VGRHSAPEDPDESTAATASEQVAGDQLASSEVRGRHASEAEQRDTPQADITQPEATDQPKRRERATQADLRLLREHPALRARCVAAALAPFVIYTIVLFALAEVHIYVLWLWAPIITAGILVGTVLDAAHRRLDKAAEPPNMDEHSQP